MTKHDNPRIIIQFLQMLRYRAHWNQSRAFDVANGVLFRFPYINQAQRRSGLQEIVDLNRGYLNW